MATTAQPQYELLVANFSRPTQSLIFGSDTDNMPPTKIRTGFVFQMIQNIGFAADHVSGTRSPARSLITESHPQRFQPFAPNAVATADVTVVSDVFAGTSASLFVGKFELVSGRDFVTGGGAAATATNIATAISALPGFSANAVGPTVTVEAPAGQVGERFFAEYRGGELNFTFAYPGQDEVLGFTALADSPIDPPTILPPGTPNGVAP